MQKLLQWAKKEGLNLNQTREYLQVLVLKSIYQSKWGTSLSFMGGTCLRICYDLRRFSEDLDFALDGGKTGYSFQDLLETVRKELERSGFKVEITASAEDVVQKSFLKFNELLQPLGLSKRKGEKLHVKLEVDTNPIPIDKDQRESFFVGKFNEMFPILKHKIPTLFSGKILALLCRTYTKGRDYYDLIWYLGKKTPLDMKYLNDGVLQHNRSGRTSTSLPLFENQNQVFDYLTQTIEKADLSIVLKDIGRFLEDLTEERWLKNYREAYTQLLASYLK